MKGGHSGIDIDKEKANAIKALGRVLDSLNTELDIRLAQVSGGTAHNAIPRDAEALIFVAESDKSKVSGLVKDTEKTLKSEFTTVEPDLFVMVKDARDAAVDETLTAASTKTVLDSISVVPHGVAAMSTDIKGLVETSNNFARVSIEDKAFKMLTSQRSSLVSKLNELTNRIEAVSRLAGGTADTGGGYPPWPANMDSALLAKCVALYKKMYNRDPVVEIIHAGLECGIIGDRTPGMDMISFGPTIKYPHSPDEKIHIGTVGMVWDFLVELLKELG